MLSHIIISLTDQITVSVILLNYNNEIGIEKSLNSIISQNLENMELIVIDDGSTDKSVKLIEKLTDKITNKKIVPNVIRLGFAKARTMAIRVIKGSYVTFVYSGGVFESPNSLKLMYEAANKNKSMVVHGKLST